MLWHKKKKKKKKIPLKFVAFLTKINLKKSRGLWGSSGILQPNQIWAPLDQEVSLCEIHLDEITNHQAKRFHE